ncbi:hypothetical protein COT42_06045 [Candidatus Saganbacteria bacterium CG08_land_8_20_14_0_20_45_16]|uniref:Fibronectin type-III domain-containing protein n=1 Tax=Candidatus Saganbacteria bacterium CG08_land_8_20_14_0_20_45_16 TaxID=2014293 RepID=A0A2H0XYH2_UNCSA|nr:MAG: hypothetical protein COT42_06045 [Candidatus Saganbacteria bacterium CG08_land_8_20_14_0_20_45_16]
MFKKSIVLGLALLIFLGGVAFAVSTNPVSSTKNPVTRTLYVANNSAAPSIKSYPPKAIWPPDDTLGWDDAPLLVNTQSLPGGSACNGLAVSSDGKKLYASIANGEASEIRVYYLDSSGMPGTYEAMAGATWSARSTPSGLTLGRDYKLYVTDNTLRRIRVFDTYNNTWISDITDTHLPDARLLDVATTKGTTDSGFALPGSHPPNVAHYKIFASEHSSDGRIHVLNYDLGTITYEKALTKSTFVRLTYPSDLKIVGDRLYVAVNDDSNVVAVMVYSTVPNASGNYPVIAQITTDLANDYGETAFDLNADHLYIKKSANASETQNRLYSIRIADLNNPLGNAAMLVSNEVIASDGVTVSSGGTVLAVSNSRNGLVRFYGTAPLSDPAPAQVTDFVAADHEESSSTLTWTNPADTDLARIIVLQRRLLIGESSLDHLPLITTAGAANSPNTTVLLSTTEATPGAAKTLVASGLTNYTTYTFAVFAQDTAGTWNTTATYHNSMQPGNADSAMPWDKTPPANATNFTASDDQLGKVTLKWNAPASLVDFDVAVVVRNTGTWPVITAAGTVSAGTEIARYDGGFGAGHFNLLSPSQAVTLTDEAVTADTTYYYAVYNYDRNNNYNNLVTPGANADTGLAPSVANEPPTAFSKLAPTNEATITGNVTLTWESSTDPNGDPVHYNLLVYQTDGGDQVFNGPVTTNSHTLPFTAFHSSVTPVNYRWNVSAQDDKGGRTYASNPEWSFNYVTPDTSSDAPNIEETIPANDQTGILTSAPISIQFSETMNTSSVEHALSISPALTDAVYSWDSRHMILTINHAAFALNTVYTVTVATTAVDLTNTALIPSSSAANPFHFTTTTEAGGEIVVSGVIIVREGSNVRLSWLTEPSSAVDIYALTRTINPTTGEYDGYFTTDQAEWSLLSENIVETEFLDTPAAGTARYYKIVPHSTILTSTLLTSNVVGKFDIHVEPGSNLISLPLNGGAIAINDVIGNQLSGSSPLASDKIYYYDNTSETWLTSYINAEGTWNGSLSNIELSKGYFINRQMSSTATNITVVGSVVFDTPTAIDLNQNSNMIGSLYAEAISLNAASLAAVLTAGTPLNADKIYYYQNSPGAGSDGWISAYLGADGFSGPLTTITPGKGYFINNQTLVDPASPDEWNFTRP